MLPWHELDSLIAESERVLLTSHVRPDGDALGSELAMADLLLQKGKDVLIGNASSTPERYRFLDPDGDRIHQASSPTLAAFQPDLLIVLDTGAWVQLGAMGDVVRSTAARKVVIDHHRTQDDLGALRLVDVTAAACGLLVFDAFTKLRGELTPKAATALFVAIAMDTGWMHFSGTSPTVLRVMADLTEHGAKPDWIYRQLFEQNSPARLRLLGVMYHRLQFRLEGRLVHAHITQADIRGAGAHPMDTEDFIGATMSVRGVETSVFFFEQADGQTKVSFRTRGTIDCSQLAASFNGGGHQPAAGAIVAAPLQHAMPMVLDAVEQAMTTA